MGPDTRHCDPYLAVVKQLFANGVGNAWHTFASQAKLGTVGAGKFLRGGREALVAPLKLILQHIHADGDLARGAPCETGCRGTRVSRVALGGLTSSVIMAVLSSGTLMRR